MKLTTILEIASNELSYIPFPINLTLESLSDLPITHNEDSLNLVLTKHLQTKKSRYWIPWTQNSGAWIDTNGCNVTIVVRIESPDVEVKLSIPQTIGLTSVIAGICLNLQGKIAIHANAVSLKNKAIAFAGFSGMGKSTLTAFCLKNGAEFITDDILTVDSDICVTPGNFRLKLYPHIGAKLGWKIPEERYYKAHYHPEKLGAVLAKTPVRLKTLYLLAESDTNNIYTQKLSPSQSVFEILHHSYFANEIIVKKPDLLDTYINFLSQIEIKQLFYPRQFDLLSQVYSLLLQEVEALETKNLV